MNKQRKSTIMGNEISKIAEYRLGGYLQKVMIEGKSKENPILCFLHGGPAMPIPFSVGCRGLFPEYTEHFLFVCWDQLGCGINDYIIDDSFTIDSYVDMTVDLIKELKKEFPANRLFLFGTSWGSILAAKAANRVPELVDNVLVMGQILKDLFFNDEVYAALEMAGLSDKEKKALMECREKSTHNTDDLKIIAAMIRKHTQGYQATAGGKMPIGKVLRGLLASPDYSLKNVVAIMKNGFGKNQSIFNELLQLDIEDELRRISVPYRILQGDLDIVTSTNNIVAFVEQNENPNMSFHMLENCGHMPGAAAMEEVLAESIKLVDRPLEELRL